MEDSVNQQVILTELKTLGVKKIKKIKPILKFIQQPGVKPKRYFGQNLSEQETIENSSGFLIPKILVLFTSYLIKFVEKEGLFRIAGSAVRQRELRAKLENGGSLDGAEPHDVAALLKQWLRELPEPLVPQSLHDLLLKCNSLTVERNKQSAILLACHLLPSCHLHVLNHLVCFLSQVAAYSDKNKMVPSNLAIIIMPSVFILKNEMNKSRNGPTIDALKQFTSIMQFLIENAVQLSEQKLGHRFYCSTTFLETRSGSELDSSVEFLDSSPKSKKRLSGPVQDLFSGLRKLVGKGNSPSQQSVQEGRECEEEDPSVHRFASSLNVAKDSSLKTPNNDLSVRPISGRSHVRRKSFGLFRRKDKRQKSNKDGPFLPKDDFNVYIPMETRKISTEIEQQRDQLDYLPTLVVPQTIVTVVKAESMKKSASDCHLTTGKEKPALTLKSGSHSCLQDKPQIKQPYALRSLRNAENTNPKSKLLQVEIEKMPSRTLNKSENVSKSSISRNPSTRSRNCPRVSSQKISVGSQKSRANVKRNSSTRISPLPCTRQISKPSKGLEDETPTNKSHLRPKIIRQDAFILNSKSSKTAHVNSFRATKEQLNAKAKKCQSFKEISSSQLHPDRQVSAKCRSKLANKISPAHQRKGSIVRGRPNSVKSGLPAEATKRYSTESALARNDKGQDSSMNKENSLQEASDLSLSQLLENFTLSTPSTSLDIFPGLMLPNTTPTYREWDQDMEVIDGVTNITPIKSVSRAPSGSSKIPRRSSEYRSESPNVPSRMSMELRKRSSGDSINGSKTKIPIASSRNNLNISNINVSFDDSCFKTPIKNCQLSPAGSTQWMSGSKYLSQEDAFQIKDPAINKRESIAMILRNKQGNVLAKANQYDGWVRSSVYGSVPSYSTPLKITPEIDIASKRCSSEKNTKSQKRSNRVLTVSSSYACNSSGSSAKNRKMSPLPPVPKFPTEDLCIESPQPSRALKEVTNVENGRSSNGLNRSSLKNEDANVLKKKQTNKFKGHSFNGHSKLSVQVSRSASSPMNKRPRVKILRRMQENNVLTIPEM